MATTKYDRSKLRDVYEEVYWREGGVCELTDERVTNPSKISFAHVLPKALSEYPQFALDADNVIFVADEVQHKLVDTYTCKFRTEIEEELKSGIKIDIKKYRNKWEEWKKLQPKLWEC